MRRFVSTFFFVILPVLYANNASASFITLGDAVARSSQDGYIQRQLEDGHFDYSVGQQLPSIYAGEEHLTWMDSNGYKESSTVRFEEIESFLSDDRYLYTASFTFNAYAFIPNDSYVTAKASVDAWAGLSMFYATFLVSEKSKLNISSTLSSPLQGDWIVYRDGYDIPITNGILDPGRYYIMAGGGSGGEVEVHASIRGGAGEEFVSVNREINISFMRIPDPVPEPTTTVLFGIGVTGFVGFTRNKRRS